MQFLNFPITQSTALPQDRDYAPSSVHANALAVFDLLRGCASSYDRGQAIFARDNCCVAHGAADVRDGGSDLLKDRRPGGVGDVTNQNVTAVQSFNLFH